MNTSLRVALLTIVSILSITACSKNDEENEQEAVDLIVGEWKFVSENDYRCGTDEVVTERTGSDDDVSRDVYFADGTYSEYNDGELNQENNYPVSWENVGDGFYRVTFMDPDPISSVYKVEFFDNGDTMRFGIDDECVEFGGENIYTYEVWSRQ